MKKTLEQAAKEYAHELYTNSSEIEEFEIADAFKEGGGMAGEAVIMDKCQGNLAKGRRDGFMVRR